MPNDSRPTARDRLQKKEATKAKILITMSSDVAERLEKAEQEYSLTQMQVMQMGDEDNPALKAKADQAEEELKQAREAAKEDGVEFVFRNVGRKQFDKLVTDHPPTDANKKDVEAQGGDPDGLQWNPETFPQALVAMAIVHPKMNEQEVLEMWDSEDWGGQELTQLFWTAMGAQQKSRVVQLGNA